MKLGVILYLISPLQVNHTLYGLPLPATDSIDPMDHFLSFDVSLIIPKNIWKMIYASFKPISTYMCGFDPYNCVHRGVCIIQILLEFSLTWIRLTWLLAFPMPWDRSDSTFHYPFESYIRNPLVHWKHKRELRAKKHSPVLPELMLESTSLCPLEHFCVLPKLSFCLWACYQEMEDWGGGGPSGGFSFSGSQTCRQRLSLL